MKRNTKQIKILVPWLLSIFILFFSSQSLAMLNPAAVYCNAMGYETLIGSTEKGEKSLCRLPNNVIVDASDFLSGKIAINWSYCVKEGYDVKRVESSDICLDCTVCILPDGTEIEVTELMGLDFRETVCGDGSCGTSENFSICPQDCPSGGVDDFCDGTQDGICDPDCVMSEENDPDCSDIFVDIKPGSCPNSFQLPKKLEKEEGVLPVAILGNSEFDVKTINPSSVRMKRSDCIECSSLPPLRWAYEDVSAPYLGSEMCGCNEFGPDGHLDLTLKFDVATVIEKLMLYDVSGQIIPITFKADLMDTQETPVRGQDCIAIH